MTVKEQISQLDGWNLIVVRNTTKKNCSVTRENVRYVPNEKGGFSGRNVGYIYATWSGADWIYDFGNGIVPSNASLSLFDYTDYISGLQYGTDDYESERLMRTPAVQHGLIKPYEMLSNTNKASKRWRALFPWDALNTLFPKRAFFTLFLPTSKGSTSTLLRSLFVQKLLHTFGDANAIHPIRADMLQFTEKQIIEDFEG
ncbi:unnamed protein product [Cylicostephanus goldi]|uniref:Uncharacterized protein n=1 Tax=Cylicostephanus goldi TaxID=71465 RepID=A0A3P7N082_CYLGO|nr:unnamed protein product [Cylicostephanus goldi]